MACNDVTGWPMLTTAQGVLGVFTYLMFQMIQEGNISNILHLTEEKMRDREADTLLDPHNQCTAETRLKSFRSQCLHGICTKSIPVQKSNVPRHFHPPLLLLDSVCWEDWGCLIRSSGPM